MSDHAQVEVMHPVHGPIDVDEDMATLLFAMWEYGFDTSFSCQGGPAVWNEMEYEVAAYICMPHTDANCALTTALLLNYDLTSEIREEGFNFAFEFDTRPLPMGMRITWRFPYESIGTVYKFIQQYHDQTLERSDHA